MTMSHGMENVKQILRSADEGSLNQPAAGRRSMDDFAVDNSDRFGHGEAASPNRNDQGRGELALVSVDHGVPFPSAELCEVIFF
jgi:hypothetical protein